MARRRRCPARPQAPGLELDLAARQVSVRGRLLDPPLSHAQFTFLALLAEEPGRVYSRDEVIAAVWPDDDAEGISDEAIDALVRRIRLRLREIDPEPRIHRHGAGLRLQAGAGGLSGTLQLAPNRS